MIWISIGRADIRRTDGPNPVNGKRLPVRILQEAKELAGGEIVGNDKAAGLSVPATRELPDEKGVAERSKIEGSQTHTPWSIQPVAMLQPPQKLAFRVENVHIAQTRPVGFTGSSGLVKRVGHNNIVADSLHIERRELGRQVIVREWLVLRQAGFLIEAVIIVVLLVQRNSVKAIIVEIHSSVGKVSSVEEGLPVNESFGQASVARSIVGFDDRTACVEGGAAPSASATF